MVFGAVFAHVGQADGTVRQPAAPGGERSADGGDPPSGKLYQRPAGRYPLRSQKGKAKIRGHLQVHKFQFVAQSCDIKN